jgi:hypothetical protein
MYSRRVSRVHGVKFKRDCLFALARSACKFTFTLQTRAATTREGHVPVPTHIAAFFAGTNTALSPGRLTESDLADSNRACGGPYTIPFKEMSDDEREPKHVVRLSEHALGKGINNARMAHGYGSFHKCAVCVATNIRAYRGRTVPTVLGTNTTGMAGHGHVPYKGAATPPSLTGLFRGIRGVNVRSSLFAR